MPLSLTRTKYSNLIAACKKKLIHLYFILRSMTNWNLMGGRFFFQRYYNDILNAHKWCFIVGCNNSGTSLLNKIFNQMESFSCMEYEGHFYTRIFKRANKKGHERVWTEYLSELKVDREWPLNNLPRLVHDWVENMRVPLRENFVEKTPANTVRMLWLDNAFPHSYFIGVVRNGYAVCEGIMRKGKKDSTRAAKHWNKVNKILVENSSKVKNFLLLKYEDLTERPDEVADAIAEFLDIENSAFLKAMEQSFSFETVLGQKPMSIKNLNAESIRRLKDQDIKKIRVTASEMLDYFKYSAKL